MNSDQREVFRRLSGMRPGDGFLIALTMGGGKTRCAVKFLENASFKRAIVATEVSVLKGWVQIYCT